MLLNPWRAKANIQTEVDWLEQCVMDFRGGRFDISALLMSVSLSPDIGIDHAISTAMSWSSKGPTVKVQRARGELVNWPCSGDCAWVCIFWMVSTDSTQRCIGRKDYCSRDDQKGRLVPGPYKWQNLWRSKMKWYVRFKLFPFRVYFHCSIRFCIETRWIYRNCPQIMPTLLNDGLSQGYSIADL